MAKNKPAQRYIYVVGEEQTAILAETEEVFSFAREHLAQVDTDELRLVLASVFARGQLFPGPGTALTPLVHEFVRRAETYQEGRTRTRKGRCTLVTAFRRLDGEISVQVSAVIPLQPGQVHPDRPEEFHTLLLDSLPAFQQAFTREAYAADSRLVAIIKEATLHHINRRLD